MSRLGQKPVVLPAGVSARSEGSKISIKGAKGELSLSLPAGIQASVKGDRVEVTRQSDSKSHKSLHGLSRTMIANMVDGTSKGYSKVLELEGVGYKAEKRGTKLVLALGFSRPIEYAVPQGINIGVEAGVVTVSGIDKQQVGDVAASIRRFHPPEPYKGKGIKYRGEHVRRKAGKTVA